MFDPQILNIWHISKVVTLIKTLPIRFFIYFSQLKCLRLFCARIFNNIYIKQNYYFYDFVYFFIIFNCTLKTDLTAE